MPNEPLGKLNKHPEMVQEKPHTVNHIMGDVHYQPIATAVCCRIFLVAINVYPRCRPGPGPSPRYAAFSRTVEESTMSGEVIFGDAKPKVWLEIFMKYTLVDQNRPKERQMNMGMLPHECVHTFHEL